MENAMTTTMEHEAALRSRWQALQNAESPPRIRDAAAELGVSEAELLALDCGRRVTRLAGDWGELLQELAALGRVMALTRNDDAVHEKYGVYGNVSINGGMGLVLNPDIDLRLFLGHWHYGYAVQETTRIGIRHSLQFFDSDGTAVHKVYLTEQSNRDAYTDIVARHRSTDQSSRQPVIAAPAVPARPDEEIDVTGLRNHWRVLRDTHDFRDLLKRFGVARLQGLRLAGTEFATTVAPDGFAQVMEVVADAALPIMIFVGSPGVVQIHSGPVAKLTRIGPWFNVLDADFNLHLRLDRIDSAWVVRKPTVDGMVTSLELYDAAGRLIAQLFGVRKPGQTEDETWRRIVEALPLLDWPS